MKMNRNQIERKQWMDRIGDSITNADDSLVVCSRCGQFNRRSRVNTSWVPEDRFEFPNFDGFSCGQWCPTKILGLEIWRTKINNESLLLIVVVIDYSQSGKYPFEHNYQNHKCEGRILLN